jgi:hypothetical protein
MLKLVADENFDNTIVRGLLRRRPNLDIIRIQDVGLLGEEDPVILAYAAEEGRVLLTHDVATITRFAYDRVRQGLSMPGVLEVSTEVQIGRAIEDILIVADCTLEGELEGQILYLPL